MMKLNCMQVMCVTCISLMAYSANAAVKVAVLPSSKNQHIEEYNPQLKAMGAEFELYKDEPDATKKMVDKIDDYAVVMTPPLHGYTKGNHKGNHETLEKYGAIVRAWVEKGGFLYIGDANYTETLTWLKAIDPSLAVETELCGQSGGPAKMVKPEDPILLAPNRVDPWWWWAHMKLPNEKTTGWRVAAVCNHDHPTIMTKRIGKGLIYITSLRGKEDKLIQNFFVQRLLSNEGLEVVRTEVPDLTPGEHTVKAVVRGIGEKDVSTTFIFTAGTDKFTTNVVVKAGEEKEIAMKCGIKARGKVLAEIRLASGASEASCYGREFYIPEFFDIKGACYRGGILVKERRFDTVGVVTTLYPYNENPEDYIVRVRAYTKQNGKGKLLGSGEKTVKAGIDTVQLKLPKDLDAGTYYAQGELVKKSNDSVVFAKAFEITILDQEPGTIVADDDGTFLLEGEPYYPLGLYHSGPDAKKYLTLGANLYHTMKWAADSFYCNLPETYEAGHPIFWENYARSDKQLDGMTEFWRDTPSLFSYYLSDEPMERNYENVLSDYNRFIARDNRHPTFVCACYPETWKRFAWACDILGANPYPYWPQFKRDTVNCNWVPMCEASGRTRPTIAVPQAFGHEGEAPLRCMSLTAVANGVNGICWYAWQNDPWTKSGARFDTNCISYLTKVIADIRTIVPALVNAKDRVQVFQKANADGSWLSWCIATMPNTGTKICVAASQSKDNVTLRLDGVAKELSSRVFGEVGKAFGEMKIEGDDVVLSFGKFGSGIWYFGGDAPTSAKTPAEFAKENLPSRASGNTWKVSNAKELQSIIDQAKDGDVIEVAEGKYNPIICENKLIDIVATGRRDKTILRSTKENRAATLSVRDFGVMKAETNVLMRGFTFVGTDTMKGTLPKKGGCVYGGTLEDCVIEEGCAVYGGGMAYGVAKNCIFRKNQSKFNGGAGAFIYPENCTFEKNKSGFDGGALEFSHAKNCMFKKNKAGRNGGAMNFGDATNSKFFENEAEKDGGAGKCATFKNCLVVENEAGRNGGAIMGGALIASTAVYNIAEEVGGAACGFDQYGSNIMPATIKKSVVWWNKSVGDKDKTRSFAETKDVENSIVQPMEGVEFKKSVVVDKPELDKDYCLPEELAKKYGHTCDPKGK